MLSLTMPMIAVICVVAIFHYTNELVRYVVENTRSILTSSMFSPLAGFLHRHYGSSADQITLARSAISLFLAAYYLFWHLVLESQPDPGWTLWTLAVLILIVISDGVDGELARRYGSSRYGSAWDTCADMLFITAFLIPGMFDPAIRRWVLTASAMLWLLAPVAAACLTLRVMTLDQIFNSFKSTSPGRVKATLMFIVIIQIQFRLLEIDVWATSDTSVKSCLGVAIGFEALSKIRTVMGAIHIRP